MTESEIAARATARLTRWSEVLVVTDANFMTCARAWKAMRRHRERLHKMAERFPLIIELLDLRFVLEKPDEVDVLISCFRTKIKAHWLKSDAALERESELINASKILEALRPHC